MQPQSLSISVRALEAVYRQRAEVERRRSAACSAFWSDHPLNLCYRAAHGPGAFSLKQFIAFVVAMPADQFDSCVSGRATR